LRIAGLLTDSGGANRSRYCNPDVDRWIEQAQESTSLDAQKQLYFKIQDTASIDLPQIYLWYPSNVLVASKRVVSVQIDPSGSWYFLTRLSLGKS
ncbi:MAG: hypothetical protein ACREDR_37910, partial [Blastocatellia bacterium]